MEELRTTFDEKLAPLRVEIAELRSFIENANQKYHQVLKKLTEQGKECKEMKKENKFLKSTVNTLDSQIKKLIAACNELEQYSRREWLEIQGIPISEGEDTNKPVMKVGELVGVEIEQDHISVSHGLPTSSKYKGKKAELTCHNC